MPFNEGIQSDVLSKEAFGFKNYLFKHFQLELSCLQVSKDNIAAMAVQFNTPIHVGSTDEDAKLYYMSAFFYREKGESTHLTILEGDWIYLVGEEIWRLPDELFKRTFDSMVDEEDKFPPDYVTITDMDSRFYMRLGIRLDTYPDTTESKIQIVGVSRPITFSRHSFVEGAAILGDYLKFKEGDAVIIHGYDAPRDLEGRLATIRSVNGSRAEITLQDTKATTDAKLEWLNMVTETQKIELASTGRVIYKFVVDQLVEVVGHRTPPEFRNQIGTIKWIGLGDQELVQTFSVEFPGGQEMEFYGYQLGSITSGLSSYERREQYWQSCTGEPSPYSV